MEAELLIVTDSFITGLQLVIGENDVIILNFADDSHFHVANLNENLGLADDVTLTDYFVDDAELSMGK